MNFKSKKKTTQTKELDKNYFLE